MKPLIAGLSLLLAAPLAMAESMSCGSRIISVGTSSAELTAFCGDPAQVTKGALYNSTGGVRRGTGVESGTTEEVEVETWIYNFGPDRLMERVRIANGVIIQMDSMGYGYNEP